MTIPSVLKTTMPPLFHGRVEFNKVSLQRYGVNPKLIAQLGETIRQLNQGTDATVTGQVYASWDHWSQPDITIFVKGGKPRASENFPKVAWRTAFLFKHPAVSYLEGIYKELTKAKNEPA